MGLDQYLYEIVWTGDDLKVELSKPSQGTTKGAIQEVGYWRKAWMIHDWFVNNCEGTVTNCGYTRVDDERLQELRDVCAEILKTLTKKQKEYFKDYSQDIPELTEKQKELISEHFNIDEAWWSPLDEIYRTYENLKDIVFEGRTFLYWPWW